MAGTTHPRQDDWRPKLSRTKWDDDTIEPTDIIFMQCLRCEQTYTAGGNGLMIDGKTGAFKPCVGKPLNAAKYGNEKCGATEYRVQRKMEIRAMPQGRGYNDLANRHGRA